jgi:hypothetical protein
MYAVASTRLYWRYKRTDLFYVSSWNLLLLLVLAELHVLLLWYPLLAQQQLDSYYC